MNKSCARCSKVVYPIEELKCLDKTWHKTCFKCHECGMTLNMKTYKGFNKLPYCEAHIPKAKATAIADTPELKRIAENTKIQSNVKYHADFEKQKGKFTQVADDPETLRIKQNTKIISNVAYHGDLEKKAAMERQREAAEVAESRDNESEYFSETLAAEQLSQYQPQNPQQYHQQQSSPPLQQQSSKQQQQQIQIAKTTQLSQSIAQNNSQNHVTDVQHQHQHQQYSHNNQKHPQQPHHQQSQSQYQQQTMVNHPSSPTTPNYQQQQQINHANYGQQNYQQQQQPGNNYIHMRTSILQNSHIPSGGQLQQNVNTKYYDQYDNYARPVSNPAQLSQNSYNNNNNNSVYSSSQHQQQQPQQHTYQYPQQQQGNSVQYTHMSGTNSMIGNGGSNGSILSSVGVLGGGGGGGGGGSGGIGKIADYDPLTDGPRNIPSTPRQSATLIYSSDRGAVNNSTHSRRIGSVADIDPANGVYGSLTEQNNAQNQYYLQQNQMRNAQQQQQQHHQQHPQQQQQQQHHHQQQQQQQQNQVSKASMRVYRALYDYEAQDTDEVSFTEGDLIYEVESIDSGWMTGKVDRTGKTGMLPANYVEPAVI